MKKQFNEYMEDEAPIQLKVLFHEMDESQAIMLQECFHAFARKVVSDVQSKDGKLPIPHVISHLKFKLEVNAGRIAEPLLKAGKQPKDDENCHKAFLMLAHLEAIEDYINSL